MEGAEYDVLIGGFETIRQSRPKLVELHHFGGNRGSHSVPKLLESWGATKSPGLKSRAKPATSLQAPLRRAKVPRLMEKFVQCWNIWSCIGRLSRCHETCLRADFRRIPFELDSTLTFSDLVASGFFRAPVIFDDFVLRILRSYPSGCLLLTVRLVSEEIDDR